MKILMLYRPHSEHGRLAEEYIRDFDRIHGKSIELIDVDSVAGTAKAELYDVMEYPAILVLKEDGQMLQRWAGKELPLMNDLAYYLHI